MATNETCKTLCNKHIPATDSVFIKSLVQQDYLLHWMVDGLPAAQRTPQNVDFNALGFHYGQVIENPEDEVLHY